MACSLKWRQSIYCSLEKFPFLFTEHQMKLKRLGIVEIKLLDFSPVQMSMSSTNLGVASFSTSSFMEGIGLMKHINYYVCVLPNLSLRVNDFYSKPMKFCKVKHMLVVGIKLYEQFWILWHWKNDVKQIIFMWAKTTNFNIFQVQRAQSNFSLPPIFFAKRKFLIHPFN